jgi:hypothetical protein
MAVHDGVLIRRDIVFKRTPTDDQKIVSWLCKTAAKAVGVRLPPGPPAETLSGRAIQG